MGLFCSQDTIQLLNLLLRSERMQKHKCNEVKVSERAYTPTHNTVFLCDFFFFFLKIFILSLVFHYTHAHTAGANFI